MPPSPSILIPPGMSVLSWASLPQIKFPLFQSVHTCSSPLRARPRQKFPLAWAAADCQILGQCKLCQWAGCVCAAPLCSFALKCATFCMVGLVCGALAVSRIKPGDFAPHCLGLVGELQLFCLLHSTWPGPWGLFTERCWLAKQEPGLWGCLGYGDSVTDFRNKLT